MFAKRNLQQNLTWKDTENLCIRMKKKIELFVYIIKNFKPIFIRTGRRIPPPLPLETLKNSSETMALGEVKYNTIQYNLKAFKFATSGHRNLKFLI